jgi:transposase InsO family protein
MYSRVKQTFLFLTLNALLLTLFSGCGYQPSSKEARKVMGDTVSTKVIISMTDPENTVVLKDALDEAVIRRFQTNLRHRKNAKTHLDISLKNVGFSALQYDSNGYIISYRTTINLAVTRVTDVLTKRYNAVGTYDFTINPNAIITDQQRFAAIANSATKALDSFVAQVAAEGSRQKSE